MDNKRQRIRRTALVVVVIATAIVLVRIFDISRYLMQALEWIDSLGFPGVFVFVGLYVILVVLLVPGSIPTLAAGAIFGVVRGTVYVSLGSTLGATVAFFIGRYLARDAVKRMVDRNPTFTAIDEAIGREGWKIVGLLRLSPVVPWSLSNYFYGITAVRPPGYVLASWIGMLPGSIVYVYIGSLFGIAAAGGEGMTTGQWIMTGVGLAATVAVTVLIARIAARAIAQRVPEEIHGQFPSAP